MKRYSVRRRNRSHRCKRGRKNRSNRKCGCSKRRRPRTRRRRHRRRSGGSLTANIFPFLALGAQKAWQNKSRKNKK